MYEHSCFVFEILLMCSDQDLLICFSVLTHVKAKTFATSSWWCQFQISKTSEYILLNFIIYFSYWHYSF